MSAENLARVDRAIGSRIRLRRAMLGLSQKQLGDAIGLTPQQVQKYEKGTNRIAVSTLARVADVLEVPIEFFYQPAMRRTGAETGGALTIATLAERRETLDLLRSFRQLENRALRRYFIDFVRQIGRVGVDPAR